ncbi:MAG TPA: 2-hydroxychromene-2-carboxylate isomerase [Acetobacteraceae bacterium]|nr:2-hydroxychromene-2-carboxylate isomerase [Acetobacteraceae bacterium]
MTRVEFHFDFGSPNAYLCHVLIPAIEQRTGAHFEYVPVLLGGVFKLTNNQPPMVSLKGIRNKPEYQRREMQRFIARHHIERFRFNPHFPVNTLLVMRAAVAAEQEGALMPYVDAVFRAMWEEERKMDDPAVVRDALDRAGLDGARLLTRAQDQAVKDRLLANTEASVARGTFGSPTFFVGDEMFFGKDRLREVEEEIIHSGTPQAAS